MWCLVRIESKYSPSMWLLFLALTDVLKLWEVLLAATELKSIHMSQAWQLEKFNHGIDNMTAWLAEVEATLSSQDFGSDLASVELLTKEHTLLERDIKTHKDIIDIIVTAAQQFSECGHFDLHHPLTSRHCAILSFSWQHTDWRQTLAQFWIVPTYPDPALTTMQHITLWYPQPIKQ